jgi:hypothetical protein
MLTQTSKQNSMCESKIERDEQTSKNTKILLKLDQTLGLLTEKLADFELKLNYVLLRRTKNNKRKKGLRFDGRLYATQETYQLIQSKKIIFKTAFIYLSLTLLILVCVYSSLLSGLVAVSGDLE